MDEVSARSPWQLAQRVALVVVCLALGLLVAVAVVNWWEQAA